MIFNTFPSKATICLLSFLISLKISAQIITQTFSYTGSLQTFTIPDNGCVPAMTVEVRGAKGGTGATAGGNGGAVKAILTASPGVVMQIYVGGQGSLTLGGFNGGGNGGVGSSTNGRGGGGASDIRIGGNNLSDRIIVAGGGGGSASVFNTYLMAGAGGGGSVCTAPLLGIGGGNGSGCNAGVSGACSGGSVSLYASGGNGGGLMSGGGLAGIQFGGYGEAGSLGQGGGGGNFLGSYGGGGGSQNGSGGGGGGYFGGSGAMSGSTTCCSGGAGGSSFANNSIFSNVTFSPGIQTGDGLVILTYSLAGPGVQASASQTAYCGFGNATLTASNVNTYTWSTAVQNTSIIVSPTTITTYSVLGTNTLGCISSKQITIYGSLGVPVFTFSTSSSPVCLGNTLVLTAGGAITYTWTNGITNGISFTPTVSSTYTVAGTNACGTSSAITSITVSPLPISIISTPTIACAGQLTILNAISSATSYSWQPGNIITSATSVAINPNSTTIYTVSATDGTCIGQNTLALVVNPLPTLSTSINSATICEGDVVNVMASGGVTYTWSNSAVNGALVALSPSVSTLYSVSGNNALGCINTIYIPVFVKSSPQVNVSATPTLVCSGNNSTLSAVGANTYSWSNGPITFSNVVTPSSTTVYTLTGSHANGCVRTETLAVNAYQASVTVTPSFTTLCKGTYMTLTSNSAISYSWNGINGGSFLNVSPATNTIYTLTIKSNSLHISCTATAIASITVVENPTVVIVSTKTVLCKNDSPAILTAIGAMNYSWINAPSATTSSIVASAFQTATYSVTGIDSNLCIGTASIAIIVNECTGLFDIEYVKHIISVYPNPTAGEVNLHFVSTGKTANIEVMDLSGRLVYSEVINTRLGENDQQLQLPKAKGLYLIKLSTDNTTVIRKVVVE